MDTMLSLIGRQFPLFSEDIASKENEMRRIIEDSRFLVIGGAGSIGAAVVLEIFKRNPKVLHVVDISENNTVELVRDIRSSLGYGTGEFASFAIDCGSDIFDIFMKNGRGYDYVLNLSALKHVRSEKDPYTLMRMIDVNIFNTDKTMKSAKESGAKKYFCVSTDKAANPVNMMGASKRIMEMFLMNNSENIPVSTARFANVAFSDGSLLYGFNKRIEKNQPIAAPNDVKRYFVTQKEAGELCLLSCLFGNNRDIFFPKLDSTINLITFSNIAELYLQNIGYEPVPCSTEDEARARVSELKKQKKYPVYFFKSDTTGEKDTEEFFTVNETVDFSQFKSVGIIKNSLVSDKQKTVFFSKKIEELRQSGNWSRNDIIKLFNDMLPNFHHQETGKFLDSKM